MTLKRRLKALEAKAGTAEDIQIICSRTIYENKDGSDSTAYILAAIIGPGDAYLCLMTEPCETDEAFYARINATCIERYGIDPGFELGGVGSIKA